MTYTYKNPLDEGYVKLNITKKLMDDIELKQRLRPNKISTMTLYYNKEKHSFILERTTRKYIAVLNMLLFPLNCLAFGVLEYKGVWKESIQLFNQRKYGGHRSDHVYGEVALEWERILNL